MGVIDRLRGAFVGFSKVAPKAEAPQGRARVETPMAIAAIEKDGFLVPLRNPKELVSLVMNEWMVGTATDKIVLEDTREGYDFILKEPEMEVNRQVLERELDGIKALFEKPNEGKDGTVAYSIKAILEGIAWYKTATADWFLEMIPDPVGRPTALWPLPSEYMREKADSTPAQFFCKKCIMPGKQDIYYPDSIKSCPKCGESLVETRWIQVDDREQIVARWTDGEILSNLSRAYGRRKRGVSKVQRVWYVCQVIKWMERYQYSAYANNTSADKIIALPKMSQVIVNDMLRSVSEEKKKNPEIRRNLMIGTEEAPVVIDLLDSLVDLDARSLAEFYREAIAINMGVSLNMLGVQTPGKLGQEIETIEVSMDTVADDQASMNEFFNLKVLPLFKEIKSWRFQMKSPKKDDLMRKSQIEQVKAQTFVTLRSQGVDAIIDENWELKIRNPEPVQQTQQAAPGREQEPPPDEKQKDEEKQVSKSLSPRNAPPGEGVPQGISVAEKKFLDDLLSIREGAIGKIGLAKNASDYRRTVELALADLEADIIKEARQFEIDYYTEVLGKEAGKEGWDPAFMQTDLDALQFMRADPMGIESALKRFVGNQRKSLFEVIETQYKTPGGFTIAELKNEMSKVIMGTNFELERIVRTEMSRITNLARRSRWDKIAAPDDVFEFVPAHDPRTCEVCNAVAFGGTVELEGVIRTFKGNPYTFEEMRQADGGKGYMHPMCRCTWVRRPASSMEAM